MTTVHRTGDAVEPASGEAVVTRPEGPPDGDRWSRLRTGGSDDVAVSARWSASTPDPARPTPTRQVRPLRPGRTRRALHPVAWWAWALALAATAMRTTDPVLLGLLLAVLAYVVAARRTSAPWARSFGAALRLGVFIVAFRIVLSMLFAVRVPGTVVFTLPELTLPAWAAGVSVGGPVTVELLVRAFVEGLRLAALVACMGAANALASPHRLLRSLPPVLYELGVAVTVALAFVPEVVGELGRMREARRLRGRKVRGVLAVRGLAVPVLEGGLERAVRLAASMDARGYGRRTDVAPVVRRAVVAATVAGFVGLVVGTYAVLDASAPRAMGLPVLVVGSTALTAGLALAGRRAPRTRYRPDPWKLPEWAVAASGLPALAAVVAVGARHPEQLAMPLDPLAWPATPTVVVVALAVALLPAWVAPPPPEVEVSA